MSRENSIRVRGLTLALASYGITASCADRPHGVNSLSKTATRWLLLWSLTSANYSVFPLKIDREQEAHSRGVVCYLFALAPLGGDSC